MTSFPAYVPTSWPLEHGTFPASVGKTMGGRTSIVRHSDIETDIRLPLQFILTEAQFLEVWNHYKNHGSVSSFALQSATVPSDYTLTGYRWHYAAEPVQVADEYEDRFVVSCVFVGNLSTSIRLPESTGIVYVRGIPADITSTRTTAPAAPTATVVGLASGVTNSGYVQVGGLQAGASWEYSTNGGTTWQEGEGEGFRIPAGNYAPGAVLVRQIDEDNNTSTAAQNAAALAVTAASSATIAATIASGATGTGVVSLPRSFILISITTNRAGWLTLYSSAAGASADAARPRVTANGPATAALVIRDPVFTEPGTLQLDMLFASMNRENPQTNNYPWRFVNDGTTGEVVITLNYQMLGTF